MIYWFFLFTIPFLSGAEINWQERQKECSVDLYFSNHSIELLDSLSIKIVLEYPSEYQIDILSLINRLKEPVNSLHSTPIIDFFEASREEINNKSISSIAINAYFFSTGIFLVSFLNIEFISLLPDKENIIIYTPIVEITVREAEVAPDILIMPLADLEPPLPLSLTNENKRLLFNRDQLALEQAKTLSAINSASFPWRIFLMFSIIFILSYLLIKYQKDLLGKSSLKMQSHSLKKRAEEQLLMLKEEMLQKKELKTTYFKLCHLCQSYLSECYDKKIEIFSEKEIEKIITPFPVSPESHILLINLFKEAFYIKFANQQPNLDQCEKAFKVICRVINASLKDK